MVNVNELTYPFGAQVIEKIIPHRYPFLFVDQVTKFVPGEYIEGIKNVSMGEPYFVGHFPGRPIMPGVIMLEALAQLGGIYAKLMIWDTHPDALVVFAGCDDVRFRRIVVPGDTLKIRMAMDKQRGGLWRMIATASVGEEKACEAILTASTV